MQILTILLSVLSYLLASRLVGDFSQACKIEVPDQDQEKIAADLLHRLAHGVVAGTVKKGSKIALAGDAECKVNECLLMVSKDYCSSMYLELSGTLSNGQNMFAVKFEGKFVNTEPSFEGRYKLQGSYEYTLDSGKLELSIYE